MYEFILKGGRHSSIPKDVEQCMDLLIEQPYVELPDVGTSRKLGIYARPLTQKGVLYIKDGIAILKKNNYHIPDNVIKIKRKRNPVYIFEKF